MAVLWTGLSYSAAKPHLAYFLTETVVAYIWHQSETKALLMQGEMSKFRDLEYCKIDLIAAKGIVFVKYAKSSSALLALESILANDCMVSPASAASPLSSG